MFTKADGPNIIAAGHKMAKKRNPVYLWKQRDAFEVETREGMLAGKPGDYLAHDPVTGDVWLVSADYAVRHYEDFLNVYKLEWIEGQIWRTSWWRDEDREERFGVWWITGGGLSRPATDVEIELWLRAEGRGSGM